jgi:hypothetical protein
MNLDWHPAIYFRGRVANRARLMFQIRFDVAPPAGALRAHRVVLRIYRDGDPANCLVNWGFASTRNAKAYAQEVLRNPQAFGLTRKGVA